MACNRKSPFDSRSNISNMPVILRDGCVRHHLLGPAFSLHANLENPKQFNRRAGGCNSRMTSYNAKRVC